MEYHTVTSLVVDPATPATIYAGTGEIDQDLRGEGIFRSIDRGQSWHLLQDTKRQEFAFIRRLSVSADGNEILAATNEGLYGSATSGTSSFKFECVLPDRGCGEEMAEVVFHPLDKDRAVAASGKTGAVFYREQGTRVWVESKARIAPESDEATWRVWKGRVALAYAQADPEIVYASVDQWSADQHNWQSDRPIWRSDNGAELFEPGEATLVPCVTHLKPWVQTDVWANLIWAGDPRDANFLILGRVDLWRSTDGGTSLTLLSDYDKYPDSAHADHHVLATRSDYGDPGTINRHQAWVGTDGGVFQTLDITATGSLCEPVTWQRRNEGYSAAEFYSGTALADGTLLTGTQDLGLLQRRPVDTACSVANPCWTEGRIKQGTAATTLVRDDVTKVLTYSADIAFALGNDFDVLRTIDAGRTWEYISDQRWNGTGWTRRPGRHWEVEGVEGLSKAVLAIDRQTPHLYLAGGCIYRGEKLLAPLTATDPPTWKWLQAPLRKKQCESAPYIVAVAVTPGTPEDLWICYDDGRVFRTQKALGSRHPLYPPWNGVRGGPEAKRFRGCRSLEITSRGTALITFDGWDRPNVYQVTAMSGSGTAYQWLPLRLPDDARPYYATAHPLDQAKIFVATENGVFEGSPGGDLQRLQGVPPVRVETLFWLEREVDVHDLYVGTYGAGMYVVRSP